MKDSFSMSTRTKLLWIFFGALFFFNLHCAATASEVSRQYGGEYRVPLDGEPVCLDPAIFTDVYAMNVAANLFDGLVEFDKDLNVVPAIAKRWKIARDYKTYTFELNKGVKFHNGREVTAEDFVYSFSRILHPETKSPAASLFVSIKGAKDYQAGKATQVAGLSAPDSHTFKIVLEEPFAPFLSILAMVNAKVVPKEAVNANFARQPVGTGPFRFREWEPGKEITLEANAEYFAGRPFLDFLRFRIYQNIDWEKTFNDLAKGLLDQSFIPTNQYEEVLASGVLKDRYTLMSMPGINLVYLGMNMTTEYFKDARVRQAFVYAVDREKIVKEITKRGAVPAKGVLPPGIAGFDPRSQGYAYDPEKAKVLLREAGYADGHGLPPIEIWTVSKSESVQQELKAYQEYLGRIGVRLVPKVAENWKEFSALINEKKVPMFYAAWYADFPDPDNFLYVLFHSQSKINRMAYSSPEMDVLLEQARQEMDYMKRANMYGNIEKAVMRDAPVICQHYNAFNYLFQPWVEGVELGHLGGIYIPFRKVWINQGKMVENVRVSQTSGVESKEKTMQ